jgi:DNA polymerase III subunit gamma/tau
MYDNLLHQNASAQLEQDIMQHRFPGALLFSGPQGSGKLTGALETARILSCCGTPQGEWTCTCSSCLQHKSLINQNMLLAGPRDCTLEIAAASRIFLDAYTAHASWLNAARYLFLRSVRKLTLRFSPVLWEDDDKMMKIAVVVSEIEEQMELVDFPRELPELDELTKVCTEIEKQCIKLESEFLYDSVPVRQIRNIALWAHMKSADGKKTVIIENADRMLESVRNALLKILEEPPEDTVFILTTSRRNAVMPTILSRVRTYQFSDRTKEEQHDVTARVFHNSAFEGSIQEFLETYLPVPPAVVKECACSFFSDIALNHIPDASDISKTCAAFDPRLLLRIFLNTVASCERPLLYTAAGTQASVETMDALRTCWNNVTIYNQSPVSSLENLIRLLSKINRIHGDVFKAALK